MRPLDTARTWLFVPGDRPDRFTKAAVADTVVIDLEDAVAPDAKQAARSHAATWLAAGNPAVVRINPPGTPWHDADLTALADLAAPVMLPKAERVSDVEHVATATGTQVVPLVETAAGVAAARELCAVPAVVRPAFGSIDLAAQLGVDPASHTALLHSRSTLVLAATAAGCAPPVDGVTTALDDLEMLLRDTVHAVELGFTGKLCVHPRQIDAVHEALRPTPAQLTWAQRVLAAAGAGGAGSAIAVDGHLVDRPVLLRAERILAALVLSDVERETRSP